MVFDIKGSHLSQNLSSFIYIFVIIYIPKCTCLLYNLNHVKTTVNKRTKTQAEAINFNMKKRHREKKGEPNIYRQGKERQWGRGVAECDKDK